MKLLQTGDLHLGKSLHETSLIEDQRFMLDALAEELRGGGYGALVIAGDVYDRTIPSADAVALFSDFLVALRAGLPELDIFIIPGNHDSAQRLSFAGPLLGAQHIYIICNPGNSFTPIVSGTGKDRAAFFLLPFLSAGSLEIREGAKIDAGKAAKGELARAAAGAGAGAAPGEASAAEAGSGQAKASTGRAGSRERAEAVTAEPEFDFFAPEPTAANSEGESAREADAESGDGVPGEERRSARILATQAELAAEAARRFREALAREELADIPTVLVAHCFAAGGAASESERVFLGTAERIDPALFSPFTYVALGHLHKAQKVGERIRYAGAPLVYAFDEAGTPKSFLRVEIDAETPGFPVTVTPVPVTPLRPVSRREGTFDSFYSPPKKESWADHYLEITLTDGEVVANPMNLLKPRYPWLLSVRQSALERNAPADGLAAPGAGAAASPENRNALDDFRSFEGYLYGQGETAQETLFAELLEEGRHEA